MLLGDFLRESPSLNSSYLRALLQSTVFLSPVVVLEMLSAAQDANALLLSSRNESTFFLSDEASTGFDSAEMLQEVNMQLFK